MQHPREGVENKSSKFLSIFTQKGSVNFNLIDTTRYRVVKKKKKKAKKVKAKNDKEAQIKILVDRIEGMIYS